MSIFTRCVNTVVRPLLTTLNTSLFEFQQRIFDFTTINIMSWRFLIIFLVIMLAAAGMAGVGVGEWLVAKAPVSLDAARNNLPEPESKTVRDSSGRAIIPEAPQPLIDGGLGVPPQAKALLWEVQPNSLFDGFIDPMVIISRDGQSYTVGDMLSNAGQDLPQGPTDIQTLDVTQVGAAIPTRAPGASSPQPLPLLPPQLAQSAQSAQSATPRQTLSWQEQLKEAVEKCDAGSFFDLPSCMERARDRFCTPNKAWGKIALCPAR
jgi:hypothetical protein